MPRPPRQRVRKLLDHREVSGLLQPPSSTHDHLCRVEPGRAGPFRRRLDERNTLIILRQRHVEHLDDRLGQTGLRFGKLPDRTVAIAGPHRET